MTAPPLDLDPTGLPSAKVLAPTLTRALPVDRYLDGHLADPAIRLHWAIFQGEPMVCCTREPPEWCRDAQWGRPDLPAG